MKKAKRLVSIALLVGLVNGALFTSRANAGLAVGTALVVSGVYSDCNAWKITGIVTGSVALAGTLIGSIALFAAAPTGAAAAVAVGAFFFDQEVTKVIEANLPFIEAQQAAEFVALSKVELAKNVSDVVVLDEATVRSVMEKGDYLPGQVDEAVALFAAN